MRRCLVLLLPVTFSAVIAQAQLVNNGATIKIQPGAVVFVAGDVQNNSGGTISNDGKLEVQGHFTNAAIYTTATADDSLIMSGAGNVLLNTGGATLSFLHINKTANTNFVTLAADAVVGGKLTYNSGTLSTDPIANTYTLSAATSVPFEFTAGREIVGRVRRTGWANGSAVVFNQPNMLVTTNGGTNPTEFTVNMIPEVNGGDPTLNEREVQRKYVLSKVGGSGYTTNARFPYTGTELDNNTEANLVPFSLPVAEWLRNPNNPVTRDAANDWVNVTGIPADSTGFEWKLADPRYTFNATAYMRGAWNNPTGLMRTTINTNGLLPLTQPYNTAPFNYPGTESVGAIPNANVVDWVLIEFRKPASGLPADALPATSVGRRAAFILANGQVVELDGVTPVTIDLNKQGAGFFVIKTRNHLAIMSNSLPSNLTGSYSNNFAVLANSYKNPSATSDPTVQLATTGAGATLWGMWPGDVNRSGTVTTADVTPINIAIAGPASGNTNVYNVRDANFDRNVTTADVSVTNTSIAAFAAASATRLALGIRSETALQTSVPGEHQ
jgi:hypothetical protein